jgi:hypothetical protein
MMSVVTICWTGRRRVCECGGGGLCGGGGAEPSGVLDTVYNPLRAEGTYPNRQTCSAGLMPEKWGTNFELSGKLRHPATV